MANPFDEAEEKFKAGDIPLSGPNPFDAAEQAYQSPDFIGASEPKFDYLKSAARNLLPAAGEAAGWFLSSRLPLVRPMLGRISPTLGNRAANWALNQGRNFAAGAGGAVAGEKLAQSAFGEPSDAMKMAGQGAASIGTNLFIEGLIKGAGALAPVVRPFASFLTDMTIMGNRAKAGLRQKLLYDTRQKANAFAAEVAPEAMMDKSIPIDNLAARAKMALDENRAVYATVGKHLPEEGVEVGKAIDFIRNKMVEHLQSGGAPGRFWAEKFGYVGSDDLKLAMRKMMRAVEDGTPLDKEAFEDVLAHALKGSSNKAYTKIRGEFKDALKTDLKAYPEAYAQWESANETTKAVEQFRFLWNKIYGPPLQSGAFDPAQIANNIYGYKREILSKETLADLWPALEREAQTYKKVAKSLEDSYGAPGALPAGTAFSWFNAGPGGAAAAELFGLMSAWWVVPQHTRTMLQEIFRAGAATATGTGLRVGADYVSAKGLPQLPGLGASPPQMPMGIDPELLMRNEGRVNRGF